MLTYVACGNGPLSLQWGVKGVSPYVEQNYQSPSEIQGSFPAGAGGQGKRGAADHLKMGARSFP